MHWGHVRSKDLIHWEQLPVALVPGDTEDEGGCFSGSAIVKDDRLYLIYTGQHYYGDGDSEHFWENQNLAYSDDGIHFTKYDGNPIISVPDDNAQDFRDPKVWEHDGKYYLVLGCRTKKENLGRILLYSSDDLINWNREGTIAQSRSIEQDGHTWECPDIFNVNGYDVITCSPEGIASTDKKFLNENEVCYSIGHLDYEKPKFTGSEFEELDHGHNFYATQTFLTPDKRRVLIGWMSPFNEEQKEQEDGWAGLLTLPRELKVENGHLYKRPIRELTDLRQKTDLDTDLNVAGQQELKVSDPQHTEFNFNFDKVPEDFNWKLKDKNGILIELTYQNKELVLTRPGKDSHRYAELPNGLTSLQIFVDTSSVEIFANNGWSTFTERYYADSAVSYSINSEHSCQIHTTIYALHS